MGMLEEMIYARVGATENLKNAVVYKCKNHLKPIIPRKGKSRLTSSHLAGYSGLEPLTNIKPPAHQYQQLLHPLL